MSIVKSLAETIQEDNIRRQTEVDAVSQLEAEMRRDRQAIVVKKLSLHVQSRWEQIKQENRQIRKDTIDLLRRSRGEYSPEKLAAIKSFRGSDAFIRSAENKCRAAFSWITDIYRGDNDLPWELDPTAVPDLPDETKVQIKQEILAQGMRMQQQAIEQAQQTGQPVDPARISKMMNDWQQVAEQKAVERIQNDARKRCDKAAKQIRDDNQEGGWDDAFKNFLYYFIRCKAGIIKGPVLKKTKKDVWKMNEYGIPDLVSEDRISSDVYAVSPFNFYPSRGMSTVNDGDIIEIHELTRQSLSDLIGVPNYKDEEIQAVLSKLHRGDMKAKWLTIDDETAVMQVEKEKNVSSGTPLAAVALGTSLQAKIQAMEFYGSVQGQMLIDWGLTDNIDPSSEYQANCWKIGDHIIKAVINPDTQGRKPYHVSSWAKNPSWIMGEGLLEFAAPIEDTLNSITRALANNIAIASGPQIEINKDFCDDKSPLYPWKRWEVTGMMMKEGQAVRFWQPEMRANELIAAWTFFSKVLDEMTVPAYAQGASQSGVTAGTATVFTQLLAAASRSIKAVVANIDDDIITPYIKMCYDNLMKFSDDPEIKGDAHVVAKGVSGLLAKEQQAQRKTEFLQVASNPQFSQVLGPKNIGYILAQIAKSHDLQLPDAERLEGSPSMDELLTRMNVGMQGGQVNGQSGAGGSPPSQQATTMDGGQAGAPDSQQPAQIGQ